LQQNEAIVEEFKKRFGAKVELAVTAIEDEEFPVLRDLRATPLETADMAFVNGE